MRTLTVVCVLGLCAAASASERDGLALRGAVADPAHFTLTLAGENFCAAPRVTFGALPLVVTSSSRTSIVSTLPAVPAGTYRVTVSCEPPQGKGEGRTGSIDVAITAASGGKPSVLQMVQTSLGVETCCQGWKFQGNSWEVTHPAFNVAIDKKSATSVLRVRWTDNVGMPGQAWCNVGIFVDDTLDYAPQSCVGAWYGSGTFNNNGFGHRELSCLVTGVAPGAHTFVVKDRGSYCYYGNYPYDKYGFRREISVEEIEPAN